MKHTGTTVIPNVTVPPAPAKAEPPESGPKSQIRLAEPHLRQAMERALKAFLTTAEVARSEERQSSAQLQLLALEAVERSLADSRAKQEDLAAQLATAEEEYGRRQGEGAASR